MKQHLRVYRGSRIRVKRDAEALKSLDAMKIPRSVCGGIGAISQVGQLGASFTSRKTQWEEFKEYHLSTRHIRNVLEAI